ncbi:hypothetical protein MKW94_008614, partial [Papaver nudicaule]|nr:hypothetical protein [Papaver nudicaule]
NSIYIFLDQVIDEHLLRHQKLQEGQGQVGEYGDELDVTDILILSQENYKNLSRNNIKAILLVRRQYLSFSLLLSPKVQKLKHPTDC